ncbi:MAG: hypothetical protein ABRQ39_22200 [Candidatus Eremiobacterota bacterium]
MGNNGTGVKSPVLNQIHPISPMQANTQPTIPAMSAKNHITVLPYLNEDGMIKSWLDSIPGTKSLKEIKTTVVDPVSGVLEKQNKIITKSNFNLKYLVLYSAVEREEDIRQDDSTEAKIKENLYETRKTGKEKEYALAKQEEINLLDEAIKQCTAAGITFNPDSLSISIFEKTPALQNIPEAVKENKLLDFILILVNGGIIGLCLAKVIPLIEIGSESIFDPMFYAFYMAGIAITSALSITADRVIRNIYSRLISPDKNVSRRDAIVAWTSLGLFSVLQISEITLEGYAIYKSIQDAILEVSRVSGESALIHIPLIMILLVGFVLSNVYVFKKIFSAIHDCDTAGKIRKHLESLEVKNSKEAVMKAIRGKISAEELKEEMEKLVPYEENTDKVEMARLEAQGAWMDFCKDLEKIMLELESPKPAPKPGIITRIKNFIKSLFML